MLNKVFKLATVLAPAVLAVGCATHTAMPYDYQAFEASNPHSILVLPPVNNSPEVQATESMYSTLTYPLAEAGYYVLPVSLVSETFKHNGLTNAADIHNVSPQKLREIFGADAALYMTVEQYGSSYQVLKSVTTVSATAKLMDLRTNALLWDGKATVVDDGNRGGNTGGGLLGALVKAAVTQIMNSTLNRSHEVGAQANALLLTGGNDRGLLYGPRSPNYKGRGGHHPVAEDRKPMVAAEPPVAAPTATVDVMAVPTPVVAVAVEPVAAAAPDVAQTLPLAVMPAPAVGPAAAASAEAPLSAAEQRYADLLVFAQNKHQSLNPASTWYRQDLYNWVMDRKDEHIRAGKTPDAALKLALAAMEGR